MMTGEIGAADVAAKISASRPRRQMFPSQTPFVGEELDLVFLRDQDRAGYPWIGHEVTGLRVSQSLGEGDGVDETSGSFSEEMEERSVELEWSGGAAAACGKGSLGTGRGGGCSDGYFENCLALIGL